MWSHETPIQFMLGTKNTSNVFHSEERVLCYVDFGLTRRQLENETIRVGCLWVTEQGPQDNNNTMGSFKYCRLCLKWFSTQWKQHSTDMQGRTPELFLVSCRQMLSLVESKRH